MAYYSKWGGSYVRRKATRTVKRWPVASSQSTGQKSWKQSLIKILQDSMKTVKRRTVYGYPKQPSTRKYVRRRVARW